MFSSHCALLVWGAFFLGYRRAKPMIAAIWTRLAQSTRTSREGRVFVWALAAVAVVVYVINVTSVTIDGPLTDGFHEGEYLGFIPALATGKAVLTSTFSVHGPGVDLLPGLVANRLGSPENGIVATRLAYAALRTVAVIASLLVVLTFARLLSPEDPRVTWLASSALAFMVAVAALQIGGWPDVSAYHKTVNARDAVFMLQVLAALVFARTQGTARRSMAGLVIAGVSGASLPWAIMYSYDRGLYGVAFLILASTAFAACGGTWARNWFVGLLAGAAIGSAALYAAFGSAGIGAMAEQVGFWIRYGRAIWAYPGIATSPDTWAGALLAGSFIALALGAAHVVRAVAAAQALRDAVRGEIGVIVLCAASISCLRMAIERGDAGHVAWGVTPSWILLSVVVANVAKDTFRSFPRFDTLPAATDRTSLAANLVMVAVSALIGYNLAFLDPHAAYDRVSNQYYGMLQTTDKKILLPQQAGALNAIRDDLRSSPCFYTLTNESTWYYLARKPSCSRFYQVTNARPLSAQREVVAALEAAPPTVILFSSGAWSNSVDDVSLFNANPEVARYVLSHYIPDRLVANNWFWRRSDEPMRFSDRKAGAILDVPVEGTRASDLRVAGTYGDDLMTSPPKALYVTDGNEDRPIWAGRPDVDGHLQGQWSAMVPTAALVPGNHRIRVWAFREKGLPMLQIGTDVELRIR